MNKYKRNIALAFLFLGLLGLLADRIIPHTHHETAEGVKIDFLGNSEHPLPEEDEKAGEKIHSALFLTSLNTTHPDGSKLTTANHYIPAGANDIRPPDTPLFVIDNYFLTKKIFNSILLSLKYFIYKAPPVLMFLSA